MVTRFCDMPAREQVQNNAIKSSFFIVVFFVNDYAQTSAEEDRASTFEYMMQGSKPACLNANMPVWNKARAMSNAIDSAFNCVNPGVTEYWERHL